jgi:PLP dependent protein
MDTLAAQIKQNLDGVLERIYRASARAGRDPSEVKLVTVTKAQPVEVIRAAMVAGAAILGENYPEETAQKIPFLDRPAGGWHMIGHLQSRKVGLVIDHFDMLQSLDSLRLAEKLDRRLAESGRVLPVLLEINVGGEESKIGWQMQEEARWPDVLAEIEQILVLPNLAVRGLMTMPPYSEDPEAARPYFVRLRKLSEWLASQFPQAEFGDLSMGTSVDFETAVEEGATYVRVGESILGPRPKR